MAELWNYLVLEGTSRAEAAEWTTAALAARGWAPSDPARPGARTLTIWTTVGGFTVVELVDWAEADPKLGRELAVRGARPVVVSHHDGAGEVETYQYFSAHGKKGKPPATLLGALASEKAWDELVPLDEPLRLAVLAPLDGAATIVGRLIGQWIRPVLERLGFRRARVDVRYSAQIDAVAGWQLARADGGRLLVRYDFSKGDLPRDCTQTILLEGAAEPQVLARLECGHESRWAAHPDLVERDFQMFAAQLVQVLRTSLPTAEARALDAFAAVGASFADLYANRRIVRVVEPGDLAATQLFRGEKLLTLRAGEHQQTFRFDTSLAPASTRITLGDIVELRGGERRARRLRVGDATLLFDELGAVLTR